MRLILPDNAEQQKIAGCLSSLDALIAAETDKLAALRSHKNGLMQQLFPANGEAVPRLRFPEFQDANEWLERKLGQICEVAQGYGFPEKFQGKSEGDYPFCKVSDISRTVSENGGVLQSAANFIDKADLKILRAQILPVGATVFAKIGEALRLNRRAITGVECLIDNNAVGLKAIAEEVLDYFLFLLSQGIDMNQYCGGAVPSVNKSTLENIDIRVPSIPEQRRIASALSTFDKVIASQAGRLETLRLHKSGLMQQLFPLRAEQTA